MFGYSHALPGLSSTGGRLAAPGDTAPPRGGERRATLPATPVFWRNRAPPTTRARDLHPVRRGRADVRGGLVPPARARVRQHDAGGLDDPHPVPPPARGPGGWPPGR